MPYVEPIRVDAPSSTNDQHYVHYGHSTNYGPFVPLQYGWHKTPGSYGYGPTIRDHYLLHFIVEGQGNVLVHNRQYTVCSGQCFAIFPHQITYYEADPKVPWLYYWIGFEGAWGAQMMADAGFSDANITIDIPHAEAVFAILRGLHDHVDDEDFYLLLCGQLYAIFFYLKQRSATIDPLHYEEVADAAHNEYVRILLSIIHTSYSERIQIQTLANRLGLNRCYMTSLFRRHVGQSIKAYLHEYRLQKALIRLQDPSVPVKVAAMECGFQDPLYFSRAFRERFGLCPQQYRATANASI